ncbi:MAG TPA: zinc-dependent alcohol dehydrogenase [Elusimicrobiota bacterium]|jgi:threonine dehydrogenase-like Zn-dependent dehydrogenase|nr:zinc-dependent alcohol dehydrogenase [Elusimicrobiota bacterium]
MKAVVFREIGDIRLEDVQEPKLKEPADAIVRLTASAICGTDLHMVRGTVAGMKPGTILGHEGVGVVEALGKGVRNLNIGDRVVITSTIACGSCAYCRSGEFAQCDNANPHGSRAGTAFFGGPRDSGSFDGMQAEKVRVPFAHVNLVRLPDEVSDEQAILLSDIFPTGYMAAKNAEIRPGNIVAVFGCGPVGLFAVLSAKLLGASRVIAVDRVTDRLVKARELGAETVDFEQEDPVAALRALTGGIGPDRVIDAVGVDAEHPTGGWMRKLSGKDSEFEEQLEKVAPKRSSDDKLWQPGRGPSQALDWAVESIAKAGTLSIVGVYPETMRAFPIGRAMGKNLTVKMGNCNHRRYVEKLIDLVREGIVDPRAILSKRRPLASAIDAYKAFDQREAGWIKVELKPASR